MDDGLESKISRICRHLPYAHLSFNSNGDLLNRARLSALAESGLDSICITLHPSPGRPFTIEEVRTQYESLFKRLDFSASHPFLSSADPQCVQFSLIGFVLKVQWPNWSEIGSNRAQTVSSHKSLRSSPRRLPCE